MYKIGIDPGITGAIAFLPPADKLKELNHGGVEVHDLPVYQDGKHQMINAVKLADLLKNWYPGNYGVILDDMMVYVEQVGAMPGQGVAGMFNFGTSYGIILGVVGALGLPLTLVRPQAWKKRAGLLHREKDEARTMAQRLYPQIDLSRKKDIGRADAILIARFGHD